MTKYDKELDTSRDEYEEAMKPQRDGRDGRETREKEQPEPDSEQPDDERWRVRLQEWGRYGRDGGVVRLYS